MNAAQIRLVFSWIMWTLVLTLFLLSARWLYEAKWPAFLLLLVVVFSPRLTWLYRGEWIISDMVRKHPFIGVWLVIYVLSLSAAIFWVLKTGFDVDKQLGPAGVLLPILGLAAPTVIAGQFDKYKELGAQSNPTVESDARKNGARGSP